MIRWIILGIFIEEFNFRKSNFAVAIFSDELNGVNTLFLGTFTNPLAQVKSKIFNSRKKIRQMKETHYFQQSIAFT